jgi:hypothetical protein
MAKRKQAEGEETAADESLETFPPTEPPTSGEAQAGEAQPKSKWVTRFGSYGDYQAGVRLIEDRKNRRMTIQFEEKPSDAVRAVLKSEEYGYRYDSEDQLWYKAINPAKPRQSREEADELVQKLANMIRQEKGLEPKEAYSRGV